MQIDYAYILAAGKGTRMGEIGKVLPKPLWPVFEKSLLELQVDWCLSLGIKTIYINSHFHHKQIIAEVARIEASKKIKLHVLHEEPLLDSGGNVHNLGFQKEIGFKGRVLLVNADQFYFFDKKHFDMAIDEMNKQKAQAVLFGLKVLKDEEYNETVLDDKNCLIEIKKTDHTKDFITYSGLGIVDLARLKPTAGISRFFDTVANFKEEPVVFVTPDKSEYWDFGTAALYAKSIFGLVQTESELRNFLITHHSFKNEKFLYGNSIDLEHQGRFESFVIRFKDIAQKF